MSGAATDTLENKESDAKSVSGRHRSMQDLSRRGQRWRIAAGDGNLFPLPRCRARPGPGGSARRMAVPADARNSSLP
jgi:hypothetical protein